MRSRTTRPLLLLAGLLALAALFASCSGGDKPQNTFDPAGTTAQTEKNLLVPVLWIAAGVFVIVEGGIVAIAIRYRHRKDAERTPPQTHGNTRLEIGWTILPAVVLAFVMVPTVATIWDLAARPKGDVLDVTVQGYQWWWGFEYPGLETDFGGPITTADVMVVPVDRPVYMSLQSEGGTIAGDNPDFEVIHSFWVPRLFGKQDVVPGRTNHISFTAEQTGTFWGQCAEFCGLQHGRMRLRVRVLSQQDWDAWVANQEQPGSDPSDELAREGMRLFMGELPAGGSCTECHAIGGTDAGGVAAPNLTHFADPTHECFAGCDFSTQDEEALRAWLRDPDAVKQGSKMPNYHLTEDQIDALVAYLYSLT